MTGDGRIWFIWITSFDQGVDHAVTDEDAAASRGEYHALCEAVFLPAPMESAPRPPCPGCVAYLHSRTTIPNLPTPTTKPETQRQPLLNRMLRPTHWDQQ
jgi:hypothetical protein